MAKSSVRFMSFPKTEPPPSFASDLAKVFSNHEKEVGTRLLKKGLRREKVSGPFFSAIVWLLVLIAWSMPPGAKGTGHLRSGWGSGLES